MQGYVWVKTLPMNRPASLDTLWIPDESRSVLLFGEKECYSVTIHVSPGAY